MGYGVLGMRGEGVIAMIKKQHRRFGIIMLGRVDLPLHIKERMKTVCFTKPRRGDIIFTVYSIQKGLYVYSMLYE